MHKLNTHLATSAVQLVQCFRSVRSALMLHACALLTFGWKGPEGNTQSNLRTSLSVPLVVRDQEIKMGGLCWISQALDVRSFNIEEIVDPQRVYVGG